MGVGQSYGKCADYVHRHRVLAWAQPLAPKIIILLSYTLHHPPTLITLPHTPSLSTCPGRNHLCPKSPISVPKTLERRGKRKEKEWQPLPYTSPLNTNPSSQTPCPPPLLELTWVTKAHFGRFPATRTRGEGEKEDLRGIHRLYMWVPFTYYKFWVSLEFPSPFYLVLEHAGWGLRHDEFSLCFVVVWYEHIVNMIKIYRRNDQTTWRVRTLNCDQEIAMHEQYEFEDPTKFIFFYACGSESFTKDGILKELNGNLWRKNHPRTRTKVE